VGPAVGSLEPDDTAWPFPETTHDCPDFTREVNLTDGLQVNGALETYLLARLCTAIIGILLLCTFSIHAALHALTVIQRTSRSLFTAARLCIEAPHSERVIRVWREGQREKIGRGERERKRKTKRKRKRNRGCIRPRGTGLTS
jgi:hypothetical protein